MAITGAIADRTRGILPITWDALISDDRYGDALLQTAIDTAKEEVLGVVVAPTAEDAYPLIVIDYVAKNAALQIIPAGIDFWMNEPISESATGTNENHTFEGRVDALRQLGLALLKETRAKAADMAGLIGFTRSLSRSRPLLNTMDDELLTPDPQEFPRPFAPTPRS